jgi:Tol biopolymer transport system component
MIARMSKRATVLVLVLGVGVMTVAARQGTAPAQTGATLTPGARWLRAVDAWEAGSYPAALEDLRTLLKSPAAAEYVDRAAALTGEPFVTIEITPDGADPKISTNGQYLAYEAGNPTVTRLVQVAVSPKVIAELATTEVAFDRSGRRLAWLRTAAGGAATEIVVRDLAAGSDRVWLADPMPKASLGWSGDDQSVVFVGADAADASRSDIYLAREGAPARRLTDPAQPAHKTNLQIGANGTIAYSLSAGSPFGRGGGAPGGRRGGGAPGGRGGAPGAGGPPPPNYGIVNAAGVSRTFYAVSMSMSADGTTLALLQRTPEGATTISFSPSATDQPKVARTVTAPQRMQTPAMSPDGQRVAYELMTSTDWEIYVTDQAGAHQRVTRDIQHDMVPRFLTATTLMSVMGEPRHRRSHLYDLTTGVRTKLFHNNSIRTISPEYIWVPSADGRFLAVQADRDGDTISAERGVSVVDLTRRASVADVLARVEQQLTAETDLRRRMEAAYKPVADLARRVVAKASVNRVFEYEKTMVDFDSKNVSMPGNAKAIDYLEKTYRSFGYEPEVQWFEVAGRGGGPPTKTANIIATLTGTEDPHLVYIVSSHFDSVAGGPGADDDTSGTAALLEASRILKDTPLPVTIKFASFTGEESGLLGSREFVRQAGVNKMQVVGALNNDMIGWAGESSRMDNTIRYSNGGIKDLQHGAAFLFTNLITYDAKYYRGTDAGAFYEAWGDIVGGIGSYPVLANPNYHQPTDFLETMNFRQIMETAKVTAATLVYLASSPARLKELKAAKTASGVEVTWTPGPESSIKSYVVTYGPTPDPWRGTRLTTTTPRIVLPVLPAGTHVAVKAVNARGLESWDWARTVIQ